jgi:DNA polymerase-4
VQPLLDKVWGIATTKELGARTVTLKLKFSDFTQITRARSLAGPVPDRESLAQISLKLLHEAFPLRRRVRLIGVSLSGLRARTSDHPEQLGFAL